MKPWADLSEGIAQVCVDLRDGRQVIVRSVTPGDRQELIDAFNRLSFESRYTRFMAPMKEASPQMVERAVNPAAGREFAVVAIAGHGQDEDIVGSARYIIEPDGTSCEFAITVADDWHGLGLATHLMGTLIRHARAHGLKRMLGFVLSDNSSMLQLARRLGFEVASSSEGPTVKLVSLDLDRATGNSA